MRRRILVSGLVNMETTVRVRQFPVQYYPIDYPFFGVNSAVSGVAYNIAKALRTLGDEVTLLSMTGNDFPAAYIKEEIRELGINTEGVVAALRQTAASGVLYDGEGKRQIYCDLKDVQETPYPFRETSLDGVDLVAACNINFNRPLLAMAKAAGKRVATDVHVLSQIDDAYNREFMAAADILFLSDEGISGDYREFVRKLAQTYDNEIVVLGRGSRGAALYERGTGQITELPAVPTCEVVNTVGAGDALFSGFLHYYMEGRQSLPALLRAEIVASLKIGHDGAAQGFPREAEVEAVFREVSGRYL